MKSSILFIYLISLLLINNNPHHPSFLVSCSSISSSSSRSNNNNNSSISLMLCHPDESSALLDFRNSMATKDDSYTRSWKKDIDCCDWVGVRCDPTSHHVVELDLILSGLVGTQDSNSTLFHLRHLNVLDLSFNDFCQSPVSPMFASSFPYLEQLDLSDSNFSGEVPPEISQLSKLQYLNLANYYVGNSLEIKMSTFPNIISNMTQLTYLDLHRVNINSTIPPSLTNLSSLTLLNLNECNLRGELPANVLNLPQLQEINLGGNHNLYANFPLSNWSASLEIINLSNINFSTKLPPSSSVQSQCSRLKYLYLRGCSFHGQIPDWVWNIFANYAGTLYQFLDLSDNEFNGTINFNDLTPNLPNAVEDSYLNLSHNYLTRSLTMSLPWYSFEVIDLSYNMFDGPLPVPQLGNVWFTASNNKFTGPVSSSVCNLTTLQILDLSNNRLMNEFPHCLGNFSDNLVVLNLGSNTISGTLPATFSKCNSLEYLDLSDNWLEELGPRSLARCSNLQVLNLRSNKFRQEVPQLLANLSHIQVLDLSCNGFFGSLVLPKLSSQFPRLQVLDLSNNNLSGKIPRGYIESFKAMMDITQSIDKGAIYMESLNTTGGDYFYSTTLTHNGVTLKYDKIITTLAILDLSNNKFEGEIPDSLGRLVSIHGLNLSHNQFTGPIPRSLSNLALLDFLDLSHNKLIGKIPQELTRLTLLEVFNVSKNQLIGPIPQGNNFNTYLADSYYGNLGLCGYPLPDCGEHGSSSQQPSKIDDKDDDIRMMSVWMVAMMGCGFGTFVSFVWGCYMLSIGRPLWLLKLVLILVDKVEKMIGRRRRRTRRGRN